MGLNVIWLVVLRKNHSPLLCWVDVEKHLLQKHIISSHFFCCPVFFAPPSWFPKTYLSYAKSGNTSKGGPNMDKLKVQKVYWVETSNYWRWAQSREFLVRVQVTGILVSDRKERYVPKVGSLLRKRVPESEMISLTWLVLRGRSLICFAVCWRNISEGGDQLDGDR